MLERKRAHLLRQVDRMAAHDRAVGLAAAAILRNARRAVTGAARTLLRAELLAGAPDFGAALGLVRARLALGELPGDAALDQILARLEPEDVLRERDLAVLLAVEGENLEFHGAYSPFFSVVGASAAGASAAGASAGAALASAFASPPASRNLPG